MATQQLQVNGSTASATRWSVGRWVIVNAAGLATVFGLFAQLGDGVEALGASHDSVVRDLALFASFLVGGVLAPAHP